MIVVDVLGFDSDSILVSVTTDNMHKEEKVQLPLVEDLMLPQLELVIITD